MRWLAHANTHVQWQPLCPIALPALLLQYLDRLPAKVGAEGLPPRAAALRTALASAATVGRGRLAAGAGAEPAGQCSVQPLPAMVSIAAGQPLPAAAAPGAAHHRSGGREGRQRVGLPPAGPNSWGTTYLDGQGPDGERTGSHPAWRAGWTRRRLHSSWGQPGACTRALPCSGQSRARRPSGQIMTSSMRIRGPLWSWPQRPTHRSSWEASEQLLAGWCARRAAHTYQLNTPGCGKNQVRHSALSETAPSLRPRGAVLSRPAS